MSTASGAGNAAIRVMERLRADWTGEICIVTKRGTDRG